MATKTCTRCKHEQPLSGFQAAKSRKDGLQPHCRQCQRDYYLTTRERRLSLAHENYEHNRERKKKYAREYAPKWAAENRPKRNESEARRRARKLSGGKTESLQHIYDDVPVIELLLGEPCHVDHKHPLSRGGTHEPDNLQIIPARLNLAKGAKLDFDCSSYA